MGTALTLDSMVIATGHHLASDLADETVILSLTDGVYYGVDAVGAQIWRQLTRARIVRDLVSDVLAHYVVDRARCEHDVLSFLEDLRSHQLAEVVASETA